MKNIFFILLNFTFLIRSTLLSMVSDKSNHFKFLIAFLFITYHLSLITCYCDTGAQFLKIGVGSRPIGMGSAFTGIANDVTALYYNPAGLSQLNMKEVSAMHNQWVADTNMDFVGVAMPLHDYTDFRKADYTDLRQGVLGFSVVNLSYGTMEGRDENRQQTGTFSASDTAVTLSYSKSVGVALMTPAGLINQTPTFLYGISVKFIQQKIETVSATGIAFDLGMLYRTGINNLNLGVTVQNIGSQMKFYNAGYDLPLSIGCGLGYNIGGITIGLDVKNYVYDGTMIMGMGTEYGIGRGDIYGTRAFSLRAGYLLPLLAKSVQTNEIATPSARNDIVGLGAGVGFKIFKIQTDYSFVPYGDLGTTQRISFSSKF